jgi:uncharacterized protein YidB (DUF937 family)
MSFLDGMLSGVVGAELTTVVTQLIQKHGGVQGIVAQLEQQGLGATAQSWIGNGPNQPISPDQVHQTFGPNILNELAAKVGLNGSDLAGKLSQILPGVIDKMTPNGTVPPASAHA